MELVGEILYEITHPFTRGKYQRVLDSESNVVKFSVGGD